MDIWGVDGAAAEAEALAAMVSFMESVGLTSDDVGIKVNSRAVLAELLARTCGVDAAADAARFAACCVLVDKLEKVPPEALHGDFGALGVAAADVDALAAVLRDAADAGGSLAALEALIGDGPALSNLRALVDLAEAGGFGDWIVVDASVVRGLAYYTGVVFEAFDRQGALRAIAGGGRYDRLLETFGGDPLPAVGFGFGDAVIMELLEEKKLVPETSAGVDVVAFALATGDGDEDAASLKALAGVAATLRSCAAVCADPTARGARTLVSTQERRLGRRRPRAQEAQVGLQARRPAQCQGRSHARALRVGRGPARREGPEDGRPGRRPSGGASGVGGGKGGLKYAVTTFRSGLRVGASRNRVGAQVNNLFMRVRADRVAAPAPGIGCRVGDVLRKGRHTPGRPPTPRTRGRRAMARRRPPRRRRPDSTRPTRARRGRSERRTCAPPRRASRRPRRPPRPRDTGAGPSRGRPSPRGRPRIRSGRRR